jgi:hypothetical protein
MAINVSNINTKGAVITIGGVIPAATNPDADGFYWGSVSGVDAGCTAGGVTVSYKSEKKDIFCDQTLAAVDTSLVSESAEISFNMLETNVEKLILAVQQAVSDISGTEAKMALGGATAVTTVIMKLEIADDVTGLLTTWTFYKVASNGIDINFERDNPSQVKVTFVAFADTAKAVGHQLFSVHEALT